MSANSAPLKIGIVCYPTPGGSGVVAVELAHELAKRNHQVHVVSYAAPLRLNMFMKNIHFHRVDVPQYPLFEYPPYSLALATKLAELICRLDLDVLHVHYAIPHAVSGWLARKISGKQNVALITTLHGTDITIIGTDPAYLPVTRFSLEVCDAVTAVSDWLKNRVREVLECDCGTQVIHNFVDGSRFKPHKTELEDRLKNGDKKPVLMHMSNYRPVKRVMDVVETFLKVRESIPATLVMIGDGPDRAEAEQRLARSPYPDDVHFLDPQARSEELFPAADLYLLPSNAESFGLSALEAMACGVPVIGLEAGGLTEVVTHDYNGFLLPVGDIDSMARAALSLLTNGRRYKEFSKRARTAALKRFAPTLIVEQYEQLYREALDRVIAEGPRKDPSMPGMPCDD